MLSRFGLAPAVVAIVVAGALIIAASGVARAGNGGGGSGGIWGNVDCQQHPYAGCQLGAGSSGGTVGDPHSHIHSAGGTSGGASASVPDPFSCLDDLIPYAPAAGTLAPPKEQSASGGGWYVSVCAGGGRGAPGGGVYYPPVWIAHGPNRPPPRVTPAELARSAYTRLTLATPRIVLSPAGQQLVNLPTWLAVTGWDAASATAGVPATPAQPAVSVTATASPTSVVWSTGDGATVTCRGPGTLFRPGDNPSAPSPTCGHTYRRSSAGQPGSAFTVTATVHWSVSWSGAGQGGTFPGLTTTATARVPVAESQALTTG